MKVTRPVKFVQLNLVVQVTHSHKKNLIIFWLINLIDNQLKMARKFFVGGNWKMNGTRKETDEIVAFLKAGPLDPNVGTYWISHWHEKYIKLNAKTIYIINNWIIYNLTEVVVGVPSINLTYAKSILPSTIAVSAQNCYKVEKGAYTGEISPAMLVDNQIPWVILGHSERRNVFGENDELIADKIAHALESGVKVI